MGGGKESTMQTAVIFSPISPTISPSLSHTGVSELDIGISVILITITYTLSAGGKCLTQYHPLDYWQCRSNPLP